MVHATFRSKGLFLQQMHNFDQLPLISHDVPKASRLSLRRLLGPDDVVPKNCIWLVCN